MIEFPLTKANRLRLASAFRQAPRVDLSIDCAVEGQMGTACVDNLEHPTAFQIQTGPFIYYAGDPNSPGGQELLNNLLPYALVMPSAHGWLEALQMVYGKRLSSMERYSFTSNNLSLEQLRVLGQRSEFSGKIQEMDPALAQSLWGQEHFIDLAAYDSPEDFIQRGVGFYVSRDSRVLGAAFASLVCSRGIEISIFVIDKYRRMGMATALACRLLGWCLERGMEPHWDAANLESSMLALKLGYQPSGSYLAYYLEQ